ncbi:MAG: PIG-L family deacetylase [Clostridiales bacterium]|nr:PIG-L family deacetylase [Clostridiales bacterium]
MMFNNKNAEIYVPDSTPVDQALARTTAICFAAHQDDIEIMAYGPIVEAYGREDKWFTGVTLTDGAGSPRAGVYERYTDDQMKAVRAVEQKDAAKVGKYSAMALLNYPSSQTKDPANKALEEDIVTLLEKTGAHIVYTHNLADKHDTHVATALKVIRAIRSMPVEKRPKKLISLEVWRGLDWLCDEDKTVFDTSPHPNLAAAILGLFDSQIAGGKRYDAAALGRRLANATFFASHDVDDCDSMSYGLDISELIEDDNLDPIAFINKYIENFKEEVEKRIARF